MANSLTLLRSLVQLASSALTVAKTVDEMQRSPDLLDSALSPARLGIWARENPRQNARQFPTWLNQSLQQPPKQVTKLGKNLANKRVKDAKRAEHRFVPERTCPFVGATN